MTFRSETNDSLCIWVDDPAMAVTKPVVRPRRGGRPVAWYGDTKPRFYRPCLVRVLEINDATMKFVFLDRTSGDDLVLSQAAFTVAYHDSRYAYSALPSTAQYVRPGDEADCGVLFLSDAYLATLHALDREKLSLMVFGDGKWPRSMAGPDRMAPPRARTRTATDLAPGEDGEADDEAETNPLVEEIHLDESVG